MALRLGDIVLIEVQFHPWTGGVEILFHAPAQRMG